MKKKSHPTPKKLIRILLGESASRALDESGCRAFAIVGKEASQEHPGRWLIHLRDASHLAAQDARDVLIGRKVAVTAKSSLLASNE